jgi:prevent-host-death family protein
VYIERRLGIRDLRLNLSRTIRAVESGDTVEVTRDGAPVARIVPIRGRTRLDQLIAEGRARPPLRPLDLDRPLVEASGEMTASEALEWLRGEG